MQAGKSAMASAKEKTSDMAASAKAGMDKTKATLEEKVDKMRAHDPTELAAAEQRKEERKEAAEVTKQATEEENADIREQSRVGSVSAYPTGQSGVATGHVE